MQMILLIVRVLANKYEKTAIITAILVFEAVTEIDFIIRNAVRSGDGNSLP